MHLKYGKVLLRRVGFGDSQIETQFYQRISNKYKITTYPICKQVCFIEDSQFFRPWIFYTFTFIHLCIPPHDGYVLRRTYPMQLKADQ